MDELYSENIIDHYKNPRNFGEVEDYTHKGRGANASCGDMIEVYIKGDKSVEEVAFRGVSCALSMASASMLTEKIKGMDLDEIKKISLDELSEMMGIEISPTRMKCVELPLKAIKKMLKDS